MSDPKKGRLKSASIAERRYDPEATRQAILAAAQRIFVDKGVGATTMRDIAEAAGVTKSLIHHHFRSKDELWKAVKQASFEQYFTAMLRIIRAEDENANPLKEVLEFTFRFHHERPEMSRLLSWMHLDGDSAENALHTQVCQEGLAKIRQAQDLGEFRGDVEAAWIQASFLILAEGYFHRRAMLERWDLGPDEPSESRAERYLQDMMKIFFEGVLPRASSDAPRDKDDILPP